MNIIPYCCHNMHMIKTVSITVNGIIVCIIVFFFPLNTMADFSDGQVIEKQILISYIWCLEMEIGNTFTIPLGGLQPQIALD